MKILIVEDDRKVRAALERGLREEHYAVDSCGSGPEAVELATLEWVAWFNHHRLLEPIGYIPPAEAEANYYRQLASQTMTV